MKLVLVLIALSFSCFAETVVTGNEAKSLFENLKGYEYSSGAITTGIEYRLTVRHNDQISCEKEETIYSADANVEYTCTIK